MLKEKDQKQKIAGYKEYMRGLGQVHFFKENKKFLRMCNFFLIFRLNYVIIRYYFFKNFIKFYKDFCRIPNIRNLKKEIFERKKNSGLFLQIFIYILQLTRILFFLFYFSYGGEVYAQHEDSTTSINRDEGEDSNVFLHKILIFIDLVIVIGVCIVFIKMITEIPSSSGDSNNTLSGVIDMTSSSSQNMNINSNSQNMNINVAQPVNYNTQVGNQLNNTPNSFLQKCLVVTKHTSDSNIFISKNIYYQASSSKFHPELLFTHSKGTIGSSKSALELSSTLILDKNILELFYFPKIDTIAQTMGNILKFPKNLVDFESVKVSMEEQFEQLKIILHSVYGENYDLDHKNKLFLETISYFLKVYDLNNIVSRTDFFQDQSGQMFRLNVISMIRTSCSSKFQAIYDMYNCNYIYIVCDKSKK